MLSAKIVAVLVSFLSLVSAQRPENTSICDYYAQTILGNNSAQNQYRLMQLILHTTVLGNYTDYNMGIAVHGAANPGTFNGVEVKLLPYFTGELASSNDGVTTHGVSKNFLDDGGPAPVLENKPSNGNTTSNQYKFFTHVYSYFGSLLGCSKQGGSELPPYQGKASMYDVHRYMDLDVAKQGYFIQQASLAVASLGFTFSDVSFINATLYELFNYRCAPAATLVPIEAGPQLQSICIADDCALSVNATCAAYPNDGVAVVPLLANGTAAGNLTGESFGNETTVGNSATVGNSTTVDNSTTVSPTSSSGVAMFTGAGRKNVGSVVGVVTGAILFAFTI